MNMKKIKRQLMLWRIAVSRRWEMFKYYKLAPWMDKLKATKFIQHLEHAKWFPWYGRKVVYVKVKENLNVFEAKIKGCLMVKDYQGALNIVNSMEETPKVVSLRSMLEGKIEV
jgi:hypothetical protein